jgi:hypothetical protein
MFFVLVLQNQLRYFICNIRKFTYLCNDFQSLTIIRLGKIKTTLYPTLWQKF